MFGASGIIFGTGDILRHEKFAGNVPTTIVGKFRGKDSQMVLTKIEHNCKQEVLKVGKKLQAKKPCTPLFQRGNQKKRKGGGPVMTKLKNREVEKRLTPRKSRFERQ